MEFSSRPRATIEFSLFFGVFLFLNNGASLTQYRQDLILFIFGRRYFFVGLGHGFLFIAHRAALLVLFSLKNQFFGFEVQSSFPTPTRCFPSRTPGVFFHVGNVVH